MVPRSILFQKFMLEVVPPFRVFKNPSPDPPVAEKLHDLHIPLFFFVADIGQYPEMVFAISAFGKNLVAAKRPLGLLALGPLRLWPGSGFKTAVGCFLRSGVCFGVVCKKTGQQGQNKVWRCSWLDGMCHAGFVTMV